MSFDIKAIEFKLGSKEIPLIETFPNVKKTLEKTQTAVLYESDVDVAALASAAAQEAIVSAGWETDSVDALICVTQSHSNILPGLSFSLQSNLGLPSSVFRMDLSDGCSGFAQALFLSSCLPDSMSRVLIVCGDTYRRKLKHDDTSTQLLFSDGASATALERPGNFLIASHDSFSSGDNANCLVQTLDKSGTGFLNMVGYQVFNLVKKVVVPQIGRVLEAGSLRRSDVREFYVHQGSGLVMSELSAGLKRDSLPSNLSTRGNLVSSSIPVLLADTHSFGDLDRCVLSGFGVGFHSFSLLIKSLP